MKRQMPIKRRFLLFAVLLLASCSSSQQAANPKYATTPHSQAVRNPSATNSVSTVSTPQPALSLIDYLRKIPGLQINGTSVQIRGINSITQQVEPLYVIDDIPVGNDYSQAANIVDVNDIQEVSVLKDVASTTRYGMQGSGGVIIITTKRGN